MGRVRQSYTAKEKLDVVKYAETHGNRAAGREFNVGESSVREWRKNKSSLLKLPRSKQAQLGSSAHYPDVEKQLLAWVEKRRDSGIAVSTVELRMEARRLASLSESTNDFKVSVRWAHGFLRRHHLSIRRRTHIAQKLPSDFEDKLIEFQRYIIKKRTTFELDMAQIGNADQTPLTFDLPAHTTIAAKGSKTVTINTTGNEKNRFTVMLACTADGGKLPPYVVFKRKTLPKGVTWPTGIIVRTQDKGWMDDDLVKDWVKTVWGRRPGGFSKRSLLVLDAFRCHRSPALLRLLKEDYKTTLAIIPGGLTSVLQPLDVSINKPMKVLLQRRWNQWYSEGDHSFTTTGRMRKPELEEICKWIVEAWQQLDPNIIVKAFKKCCISNNLDGTEDDSVWDDMTKKTSDDDCSTTTDEEDHHELQDYYKETPTGMTDEQIEKLFESDSDEEEFEGFDASDIDRRPL